MEDAARPQVDDVVTRYRAASEANDIDSLTELLEPDAELISPLSGRMVSAAGMICASC
jgi:ketosteroid isomerase-like protein